MRAFALSPSLLDEHNGRYAVMRRVGSALLEGQHDSNSLWALMRNRDFAIIGCRLTEENTTPRTFPTYVASIGAFRQFVTPERKLIAAVVAKPERMPSHVFVEIAGLCAEQHGARGVMFGDQSGVFGAWRSRPHEMVYVGDPSRITAGMLSEQHHRFTGLTDQLELMLCPVNERAEAEMRRMGTWV